MRSLFRTVDPDILRDAGALAAAAGVVGASFGAIAVSTGMPWWLASAMSVLVFAGASQFTAVAVAAAGGGALPAVLAGLLLNARHLPLGVAVGDILRTRRNPNPSGPDGIATLPRGWVDEAQSAPRAAGWRGRLRWLLGSHLMTDESVAFALAQPDPGRRRTAYWTSGLALLLAWNLGVLLGTVAGGMVGDPAVLGLDAAFPAALLALLIPSLRSGRGRVVAATGAGLALAATPFLPAGVPVLLAVAATPVALLVRGARPRGARPRGAEGPTAPDKEPIAC